MVCARTPLSRIRVMSLLRDRFACEPDRLSVCMSVWTDVVRLLAKTVWAKIRCNCSASAETADLEENACFADRCEVNGSEGVPRCIQLRLPDSADAVYVDNRDVLRKSAAVKSCVGVYAHGLDDGSPQG